MLYDNGQLVSLYSEAYSVTPNPLYKEVVYQTIEWLEREMTNDDGGFYSALDADSEGEEGKFYVWTQEELEQELGRDAELIMNYYNVRQNGNWEHGKNILHRTVTDEQFAMDNNIGYEELRKKITNANEAILDKRSERIRPGLDDKALAGWNGLMLKGLVDAYNAFGEKKFLDLALRNATFIKEKMTVEGRLLRSYKGGIAKIDAYLEDYAFVIDGYLALYQVTFDEMWLNHAKSLANYTLAHFFDKEENLFFYTDNSAEKLIARKKEIFDNVIPASNSQMAINLYLMGVIFDDASYKQIAQDMIGKMSATISEEPAYLSNWAILYSYMATPTAEISIVGEDANELRDEFVKVYNPNKVIMGAKDSSSLPLMEGKHPMGDKTTIYVCYNKTCKLPVNSVKEALNS